LNIREAKESDLPAMVDIYNASARSSIVSTNTRPATIARSTGWFRQHKAAGKPVLVAEEEGRVIGWLSFRPFYRRPAYDATAKVMVYVAPEARGRGVGTKLLSSAISCGKSAGLNTLVCYLLSDNVPAQRLFEDSGFQKWGHFPGVASIGGRECDLVIMGRRI
jgi:L-amino acid N-acyltransferase YncA